MTRRNKPRHQSAGARDGALLLRVAVALGDPERERAVLSALDAYPDIVVAERCLSTDRLLEAVRDGRVDAVLAASSLHRLTDARLAALVRTRIPIVLLTHDVDDARWASFPGMLVLPDADPGLIYEAVLGAARGEHLRPAPQETEGGSDPVVQATQEAPAEAGLAVLAVAGGPGSGRTTAALNIAAALGVVARTILVDFDLHAPGLAAFLDADPTRNLAMVAHAEPETPRDWDRAIEQEVQPLHPHSPHAVVLCGLPKPELRSGIPPRFAERLIAELAHRYRYVLVDVGSDLLGPEATVYGATLAASDQALLVSSPDLVGLWRTRTILKLMQHHLQLDRERIALMINRYDRRYHHGRAEIEWALEVPAAAVIPHDHRATERALANQRPLVLGNKSRAGRAFLEFAARVHGGKILLPPEEPPKDRRRDRASWLRWPKVIPAIGRD